MNPADEDVVRDRDIEIQSEDEYIPINIKEEVKRREAISLTQRLWFYAKILFALFCVTIVMVAIYSNSEIWSSFNKLTNYIRSEETTARGAVIIGAIYILADFVFIPGSLYCVWAGYTFQKSFEYGPETLGVGVLVLVCASWISSLCVFSFSRYVYKRKQGREFNIVKAIDTQLDSEGQNLIFLVRLSPLAPFQIINFLLGLSAMSWTVYLKGLCLQLPITFVYLVIGLAIADFTEVVKVSHSKAGQRGFSTYMMIVIGIFSLFCLAWSTSVAKYKFDQIIEISDDSPRSNAKENEEQGLLDGQFEESDDNKA